MRVGLIFLPLAVITAGVVAALYWNQSASQRSVLAENQRNQLRLLDQSLSAEFPPVIADLRILSHLRALRALLVEDTPAARQALAEEFQAIVRHKQVYDQARFLDARGMEVVRVNWTAGQADVTPREKLQHKRDRYYFTATLPLRPGEVYVSPLDLNVEDGRLEHPLKPVVRFATPVHDAAGQVQGVVVLNYLGSKLLGLLPAVDPTATEQVQLLNSEGYWLRGESSLDDWAFMHPDRLDRKFGQRFAEEWREIAAAESAQLTTAAGLWTSRTVRPFPPGILGPAPPTSGQSAPDEPATGESEAEVWPYAWKLVSRVPPSTLAAMQQSLAASLWRLFGSLLAIELVVAWLWARLLMQHEATRRHLMESERLAAIGEAMAALAHESRNALQRSQAGLDMLASRVADRPEAAELLHEVQQAQYFLRDLYEKCRNYAAPLRPQLAPVDVAKIVDQTWEELASLRAGRTVELVQHPPPTDTSVPADAAALGQVFRNLLQNALEASPSVTQIDVRYHGDEDEEGPTLVISLRDNGPGLTAQQRAKMFQPFYTTKPRGTGLGLSISQRIITAHGGQLEATPATPGAEFLVTLRQARR